MKTESLAALLTEGVQYEPHYLPAANSDHLPMTLCALHGLGADDSFLLNFREGYRSRLQLCKVGPTVSDWRDGIGKPECYFGLMMFYADWLARDAQDDVLNVVLPELLSGIALDAFHPIIRMGFARDFDCAPELAASLATMTSVHQPIAVGESNLDLVSALEQQVKEGPVKLRAQRFGGMILELNDESRYPSVTARDLAEIAECALTVYRSTRNFFALHLVTATQALRCTAPTEMKSQAISAMSSALVASHLVLGSPKLAQTLPAPNQLDPEHAYKYCWACLSEFRASGNPVYIDEIRLFVGGDLVPHWVAESISSEVPI